MDQHRIDHTIRAIFRDASERIDATITPGVIRTNVCMEFEAGERDQAIREIISRLSGTTAMLELEVDRKGGW